MVANPEKIQLIFLGVKDDDQLSMSIDGKIIESSKDVKLLGITIDKKLSFKPHVKNLCK